MTSTTNTSTTTTDEMSLDAPARVCMPWCRTNDGHEGEAAVDQTCWSKDRAIPLETEDPVSPERLMGAPRDPVPYSVTYLEAPLGESTRVCVGFGDLFSIKYTPTEARRLAAEIIELATVAER